MYVYEILERRDRAARIWERFTNDANPPNYADDIIAICEEYIDLLEHLKVDIKKE